MFRRTPLPTIRAKLFALVLACALPILLGYFAFARDATRREREHVAMDAQTVTAALAAAVDRDLASGEAAAQVLAASSLLDKGQLAAFHADAKRLLRPDFPAHAVVLYDAVGTPLLHTRYAFGSTLPAAAEVAQLRRVADSGESATSGLHAPGPGQPNVVTIDVPVWQGQRVAYVLSVQLRPRRLAELLNEQQLPPRWVAEVFDSRQQLVARSADLPDRIDDALRTRLTQRLRDSNAGIVTLSGKPAAHVEFAAFARSPEHRWTVVVAVPPNAAQEMLGQSPATVLASVAGLLGLSLAFAWLFGGAIARSVSALTAPAAALGRGEPVAIPALGIREAAEVADALRKVDGKLQRYRSGLEALVAERTAELERSKALLETIYATAPVGLSFMDSNLRFVKVNEYMAALNATTPAAHVGRTLPELLGAPGVEFELDYRRVLDSGQPYVGKESSGAVPAEPDAIRHWIASYYPVFGPDRAIVGINAVVLDITDRKQAEQRDRDNQELFRALFEGSGDAHMLLTFDEGRVSANRAAAALFGCDSVAEFLAMPSSQAWPEFQPDGRRSEDGMQAHKRAAMDTGGAHFEWLHRRRDGATFHADVVFTRIDIGGMTMMQATIRDISARVAAEAALRATSRRLERSERFIRTVTDHLPGMLGYWTDHLRCQFANRPYLRWLGRAEQDVLGQHASLQEGAASMGLVQPYVDGVLDGRPQSFSTALVTAAGERTEAWGNYIPDRDDSGRVRGFFVLYTDVTELTRTQERLVQALHEAEQANSAKGRFLANMSHEIRTPMNAILGLARLLEEAPLGRRERGYVARMQMAAKALLGMLSDVLDFSRVEAGQLVLEHRPFLLDDVLDTVTAVTAASAWGKGVEPVFVIDPDVPAQLVGDPVRLGQVLLNLMGNAIKFTAEGEVVLTVRLLEREPAAVRLGFAVRDTGIGIAHDQQERMFEAFSQGDSSTSRKYGGVGLGLAISRRLVELMGGHLGVDSAAGHGATFQFALRLPVVADARPLPEGGWPRLRVLVADDNPSACAAIADACAARGWQVTRAAGGQAALAQLCAGARFDLAFLDASMRDLDGASVLAQARARATQPLPRCALLAADPERERLAALAADLRIDAILGKPFTRRALHDTIEELRHGAAVPASAPPLAARLHGLRVLLVEDNPINQEVASYTLTHAGAQVDIADNGRVAVSMLTEAQGRYDAVLMDLQMPVLSGLEASAEMRALGYDSLPIIAMTANAMAEDRARSLQAGMNAHLAKPIDVDELVDTLLRLTGGARPASLAEVALAPPLPDGVPGIHLKETLPRFGGSFAAFAAVFRRFAEAQADVVPELRSRLRAGDRPGAQQLAHRLRGVAANLGATDVARHALAFEQALRGADEAALALQLARLDAALQVVFDAARELASATPDAGPDAPAATASRDDLLSLLELLQQNNMKAMTEFDALRPALTAQYGAAAIAALADAVGTLRFDSAAARLHALVTPEDPA